MPILKKYNAHPRSKILEESSYKSGPRHIIFFLDGSTHVGEWNHNVKEGKGASFSKQSKLLYEGDFLDGKRNGYGVLSSEQSDGSNRLIYRGQWKNNKRHGYGMQKSLDGSSYEGEWANGNRHGNGRAWFSDDSFYQGTWKNNKVHGSGVLILPTGNWFEGEFNNGYRHGKGKYFHYCSQQIQEGVWSCGVCVSSTMVDANDKRERCIPPNNLLNLDEYIDRQLSDALTTAKSMCNDGNGN